MVGGNGNDGRTRTLRYKGSAISISNDEFDGYGGNDISPRERMVFVYCRRFVDRTIRCIRVDIMKFTRKEFALYCHKAVFDDFTGVMDIPKGCSELTNIFWTGSLYGFVVGLPRDCFWAGFQRCACFVVVQGDLSNDRQSAVLERRDNTLVYYQQHLDGNVECCKDIINNSRGMSNVGTYGAFVDLVRQHIHKCVRQFKLDGLDHKLSIVVHCRKINGNMLVRLPDEDSWKSIRRDALYFFARSAEDSQKVQILCLQHVRRDEELLCVFFDVRSVRGSEELVEKVRRLVFEGYEGSSDCFDVDINWLSRDDANLYKLPVGPRQWRHFIESVAYIFGKPAWVKPPRGQKRKRVEGIMKRGPRE